MTYTEKRLEEFRNIFLKDESSLGLQYLMTNGAIKKFELEKIESFLAKSIQQAIAEDRERMRGEIKEGVGYGRFGFSRTDKGHEGEVAINIDDLLSSLDKLTANNKDI